MTKSIRISEKIHTKLKIYVARSKESIIDFADKAIKDAIELAKIKEKNYRNMNKSN
jgi:hypothetical protein